MTNSTSTNYVKEDVFAKLNQMFHGPSPQAWGSATYVRNTIRNHFGLTHRQAKSLHEEWSDLEDLRQHGVSHYENN